MQDWDDLEPEDDSERIFRRSPQPTLGDDWRTLLIPLTRAQDAVARLEAAVEAASSDVGVGLRARLSLLEAANCLGHHSTTVHPHDLALREAGLTGSYSSAWQTGRLEQELPWSHVSDPGDVPDDWAVSAALEFARLWRQLAELSSFRPWAHSEQLAKSFGLLGAHLVPPMVADWWATLPESGQQPALLATAILVGQGLPENERGDRIGLAASYASACLWRRHGYGQSCSLPFWSAPLSHIDALAWQAGTSFHRGWLGCVTEAALRGRRELGLLQNAERKAATLPSRKRSHLAMAARIALRRPVVTARGIAEAIGITPRAGLELTRQLVDFGLLREMTGRQAWRAFAIVG